jgi:NADPH:quinone reductase-like Zn-dependent oxidoreductase
MTPTNKAAYLLSSKATPLEVKDAPYPVPRDDEVVVKTHAVAINPVDWILQEQGTSFMFTWLKYPFVLGTDVAGEVVQVGPRITRFKPGERVLGQAIGTDKKRNSAAEGAFQHYVVLLANLTSHIPDTISYESASVIPLGLSTAACGLFQND